MKKSSWKTTLGGAGGLVVAFIALFSMLNGFMTGDAITLTQVMAVIAGFSTGLAGISARDNDVTSEDAGAK